jgi:hypothetical protein
MHTLGIAWAFAHDGFAQHSIVHTPGVLVMCVVAHESEPRQKIVQSCIVQLMVPLQVLPAMQSMLHDAAVPHDRFPLHAPLFAQRITQGIPGQVAFPEPLTTIVQIPV